MALAKLRLRQLGLESLRRLTHFPFSALRNRVFGFFLPAIPHILPKTEATEGLTRRFVRATHHSVFLGTNVLNLVTRRQRQTTRQRGRIPSLGRFLVDRNHAVSQLEANAKRATRLLTYTRLGQGISRTLEKLREQRTEKLS